MYNVCIDPKMFSAYSDSDIQDRIQFFNELISLANDQIISICLYGDFCKKLKNGNTSMFPIDYGRSQNKFLKSQAGNLNALFFHAAINHFSLISPESCGKKQNISLDRLEMEKDDDYGEFICVLLATCYSDKEINDIILVGKETTGLKQGDSVNLSCSCKSQTFERKYIWESPHIYISPEKEAENFLKEFVSNNTNLFEESPKITKGQHHNKIQKRDFNTFEELELENRRVLSKLRFLGMKEITFKQFKAIHSEGRVGDIKITNVIQGETSDIIEGQFIGNCGFQIVAWLYFPSGIGDPIRKCLGDNMTPKNVEQLLTNLGLN